jgi:threonine dehydratase
LADAAEVPALTQNLEMTRRRFLQGALAATAVAAAPLLFRQAAGCQAFLGRALQDASLLPVTAADVLRAQDVVSRVALHTALIEEQFLSRISEGHVYLKPENLQRTGAFKIRGAYNKIASLSDAQRAKGVIAASAGNHAQGVALAAKLYRIPAVIVMPESVPKNKLEATQAYGAEVVLYGKVFDESLARAKEIQQQSGAAFVHPYDDPMTIAGQGTIGLEVLHDLPDADVFLVPIGGGGLASGIAVAVKSARPSARIIGVEPKNAPSMAEALKQGKPVAVQVIPTLADGTAVGKSGTMTFAILQKLMDDLITVSEDEIAEAIRMLLLKDKLLAEGAGALGAAALLSGRVDVKGKKTVVVVSGGNIDSAKLQRVLAV